MGRVLASALEVVAVVADCGFAEGALPRCRVVLVQKTVIHLGAFADRGDQRRQRLAQLLEDRTDGCRTHAKVGGVDQRVGDMAIAGEKIRVAPAQL